MRPLTNLSIKGVQFSRCAYTNDYVAIGAIRVTLEQPSLTIPSLNAQQKLNQKPKSGLWWSVVALRLSKYAVIRNHVRRRYKTAITMALKAKGFDVYGRSLNEDTKGLTGSLEVKIANPGVLQAKHEAIKKDAGLIVDEIIWQSEHAERSAERSKDASSTFAGNGPVVVTDLQYSDLLDLTTPSPAARKSDDIQR